MNRSQFELALNQVKPSDWAYFETLCSTFLASEHPNIRTLASVSGDGGRDAELFSPDDGSYVCAQYSVTKSWKTKIKQTKERVISKFKDIKIIIYMSNREIGADADEIKAEFLKSKLFLDVRDKNWFLERYQADDEKYKGAEEFFDRIGRPYLEGCEVITKKRPSLSNQEAKAALVYLGMQLEDSQTAKGLTKLSYEALVRAALRKTSSSNCMSKESICQVISSYLPSHSIDSIRKYVESVLNRLNKNIIKKKGGSDAYHLAFDESERLNGKLATQELHDRALDDEIILTININPAIP